MIPRRQKPVKPTCATCGDRKCRRKFRVVCWLHCGRWKPEVLPVEKFTGREMAGVFDLDTSAGREDDP